MALPGVDHETASRTKTGTICAECSAEFTRPSGFRVCCGTCKRLGSPLPVSKYPEVNREAHRANATKRKQRREQSNA